MTAPELDLAAVKATAEAASKGPWDETAWKENIDDVTIHNGISPANDPEYDICELPYTPRGSADAEHIATMDPTTTLALVDRLEQAEREVERLRAVVAAIKATYEIQCPPKRSHFAEGEFGDGAYTAHEWWSTCLGGDLERAGVPS